MSEKRSDYQKNYQANYRQRNKRVGLVLDSTERRAFERAAGKRPLATFIKELALAGLQQQAVIPDSLEAELKTLRFAVLNIANNVNQMAHYSHTVRSMTTADDNNLLQHLKQLDDAVKAFTEQRILDGDAKQSGDSGDDH